MACRYVIKNAAGEEVSFDTREAALQYAKENNLINQPKKGVPEDTTETLANVLRQVSFGEANYSPHQLREFQENLLDKFIHLEEESQFFYKLGPIIALTKGMGKSFDAIDTIKKNLGDLLDTKKAPFDVRYLLTGNKEFLPENASLYTHNLTANNLRIAKEVDALGRTMFMERTPSFINSSNKVVANLRDSIANIPDKMKEIKDELSSFAQIAAYKKWLEMNDKSTTTLRNSLIYDATSPTIVDIVREASKLSPDNTFLKFILPVSTTIKVGKKKQRNITNKDLINTIEGKTRGRIEPDMISNLMDSFTELYQNPQTQFHAKALFDYLIVKDGLMFKNKSFIKMLPTFLFKDISNATERATKLLAANTSDEYKRILKDFAVSDIVDREGNFKAYFSQQEKQEYNALFKQNDLIGVKNKLYQKVFGFTYNQLYHRFEQIYGTDVRFQFNLDLIRPKVKISTGVTRQAEGIQFAEENGRKYMHVALFTDKFRATEKGSDERKSTFKDTLDQLEQAGFTTVEKEGDDNKVYLQFKKFIRLRAESKTPQFAGEIVEKGPIKYDTYQLTMVERDGKRYSGESMTAEGDLIPKGIYAVYTPVDVVGTSNSTGVADVGVRPTREQIIAAIDAKNKGNNNEGGENQAPPVVPTAPRTPSAPQQGGETVQGGIFGGMQQLSFDPNEFNPGDLDIGDDDINDALKDLDNC